MSIDVFDAAQLVVLLIGAVWVVHKIDKTTAILNANLENNTKATNELSQTVKHLDQRIDHHDIAIELLKREQERKSA